MRSTAAPRPMVKLQSYTIAAISAVALCGIIFGPTIYTVYYFNPRYEAKCTALGGIPISRPGEPSYCAKGIKNP